MSFVIKKRIGENQCNTHCSFDLNLSGQFLSASKIERDASNPRCCKNAVQMPLHHKYRSFGVWRIYIGFGRTRLVYLSDWRWKASLLSSCSNKLDISFPALAYALIINTPTSCVWPGRVSIWFETCKPVASLKVYVFSRFFAFIKKCLDWVWCII